MFTQELASVFESFESTDSYDNVLSPIDTQWIEEALLATDKASIIPIALNICPLVLVKIN
ncbi:hypothetical protein ACMAZF_01940 [Psychrobium sp. nBUS_13]|uniref:hypothetical protein n=1 Tax=Psychrobium sp. nBUS_13 TaxID=3395319 RepID=UPI003EBF4CA3